jgi:putative tricarboxylic transport membrane protein
MRRRDLIAGLVVVAASLFLFWRTLGLERNPLVPIGPAFYPRIVLGITALLGLALAVSAFLSREAETEKPRVNYAAVALQFAAFAVYTAVLPFLGFRIATVAYVAAANLLLDPPRRAAHWGRAALIGVVTAAVTYYAFEGYLAVLLPRGAWTDF